MVKLANLLSGIFIVFQKPLNFRKKKNRPDPKVFGAPVCRVLFKGWLISRKPVRRQKWRNTSQLVVTSGSESASVFRRFRETKISGARTQLPRGGGGPGVEVHVGIAAQRTGVNYLFTYYPTGLQVPGSLMEIRSFCGARVLSPWVHGRLGRSVGCA